MSAERVITLLQGEHAVTGDEAAVLVTVLGSCVAACLRDPVAGLGGMNHFLLPGGGTDARGAVKYGLHAMELLINALIRAGASRGRLEAKLFGGAQMLRGLPDIGRANAAFAEDFLRRERLRQALQEDPEAVTRFERVLEARPEAARDAARLATDTPQAPSAQQGPQGQREALRELPSPLALFGAPQSVPVTAASNGAEAQEALSSRLREVVAQRAGAVHRDRRERVERLPDTAVADGVRRHLHAAALGLRRGGGCGRLWPRCFLRRARSTSLVRAGWALRCADQSGPAVVRSVCLGSG